MKLEDLDKVQDLLEAKKQCEYALEELINYENGSSGDYLQLCMVNGGVVDQVVDASRAILNSRISVIINELSDLGVVL